MRKIVYAAFGVLLVYGAMAPAIAADAKSIKVPLSGASEVPAVESKGKGTAEIKYDPSSHTVNWKVSYSGLSSDAVAAHIHGPAAANANAGVMVDLGAGGMKNPLEGSAKLTDAQAADFMAGKTYVNVHTSQHPAGEIRGQITP